MGDFFPRKQTDEMKKPNLNAPRIRKTFKNTLDKELFQRFVEKYPDYNIDWKTFKNIINVSNGVISEMIVESREGVDLPYALGKLMIGACNKKKGKNYDYTTSSQIGKEAEHKNWESNRYLCKIFYSTFETKYKFPMMDNWCFKPCRELKRSCSRAFRKEWNKFMKVPSFQKIGYLSKLEGIKSIKIIKNEKKGSRMDFSDTQPE